MSIRGIIWGSWRRRICVRMLLLGGCISSIWARRYLKLMNKLCSLSNKWITNPELVWKVWYSISSIEKKVGTDSKPSETTTDAYSCTHPLTQLLRRRITRPEHNRQPVPIIKNKQSKHIQVLNKLRRTWVDNTDIIWALYTGEER